MKIDRISRIKKYRVFQDFSWPQNLPNFAQFNVIYGWNGTGKTSLSNLFRAIERKENIENGDVEFVIGGKAHNGKNLSNLDNLPRIRVFNRNYVDQNLFITKQAISPIYYLGEDSVEKQKKIEELTPQLEVVKKQILEKSQQKQQEEANLDSFCTQQAKTIKELLSSIPSNNYNNYNKSHFRKLAESFIKNPKTNAILSDSEKIILKQQKDNKLKKSIGYITANRPDLFEMTKVIEDLLTKTVVSSVIPQLANNAQVSEWVEVGLRIHKGEHASSSCRFCTQPIPDHRLRELEAHFNNEYANFLSELDAIEGEITQQIEAIHSQSYFPVKEQFYDHLAEKFTQAMQLIADQNNAQIEYLRSLHHAILKKRSHPFEVLHLEPFISGTPLPLKKDILESFEPLDQIISSHNAETEDFQKTISTARERLEHCLAAESLLEFIDKSEKITLTDSDLDSLAEKREKLSKEISELKRAILGHLKPATELNEELCSYLGRNELTFTTNDTGYEISRNGFPAQNLSEGEQTAIAFLYFLKSLQDVDFSLKKDIIVIDDPVSSLDTNALFCAFGYLKERTKESGQLFILTHSFGFFRQIKNWFNHLPEQRKSDISKRPARFYMLQAAVTNGARNSSICSLDPLLHEYDSEYHYLFKKVLDAKSEPPHAKLEDYYAIPNIARRLMESFLSFRFPAQAGELKQQLDKVAFDPAKKARILRFLHTFSHDGKIGEPEHDLSILSETPQILSQLLQLIETEDAKHYHEMVRLTTDTPSQS